MTRIAVVTGGASGIGKALATELVRRGVDVTVADIKDHEAVANELGCNGSRVDVTDAEAVHDLITGVKARHGRLDFLFNNAGIGVNGRTEEMTLEHWRRSIEVNLVGVVHGVHAAYPIMIEQGFGWIVNTASLAGLIPVPLLVPYVTAKHAVVGLSTALRAEASAHGVKVMAVCPGFVDTPLLDNINPGLPQTNVGRHTREIAVAAQGSLYPPDAVARDVMRGLERDQPIVISPGWARNAWWITRLSPRLILRLAERAARRALT
ncbi:short-chain dehydrogenase [Planotetraspora thailandica]|uniref:Short-chain dehydrogenase n=1 Tax=Planotetraspora thailandica TaxID=487172 RepID=A0A8J3Y1P7_9ACTN|nr:SDR family oxidoreductase [Planotetraspora thailandica]GII59127.1 short-chain dehydrogenase [Planotetraspora thailandica]